MNDDQVSGWRAGDPTATTTVRNSLRALADSLLATPGVGLPEPTRSEPDRRRDLSGSVAREVMQRGGSTADDLLGLAVMVSARVVIQTSRESRPSHRLDASAGLGDSHLPPQLVVSFALAPDSLSGHVRTMAERHLAGCPGCTQEADQVRRLVRGSFSSAGGAKSAREPVESPTADEAPPRAPPPSVVPPGPGAALTYSPEADPTEEVVAYRASGSPPVAKTPPATKPPPAAPARPARVRQARARTESGGLLVWWPVIAIAAVLAIMLYLRHTEQARAERSPEVAGVADRSPPALPDASSFPADAQSALLDLERGDCRLAALRLRTARLQYSQRSDIAWTEAGAWVCAGQGDEAFAALSSYEQSGGQRGPELLWIQAQTALLQGDARTARELLVRVRPLVDLERGRAVDDQLDRLRSFGK